MLGIRAQFVAVLLTVVTCPVHSQDWEEQSQMEADYSSAGQDAQYGIEAPQEYVQEAPVQEEYVQEEYVQEEYVQEEQVVEETYEEPQYDGSDPYQQDGYAQEEPIQEELQYEQQEEYPADTPTDLEWVQQQGSQCMEYADADGLEGEERDEYMRSCMQP